MKNIWTSFLALLKSGDERNFFVLLTFIHSGLYTLSLISSPALLAPIRLIPFTILMIAHIVIYWLALGLDKHPNWIAPYLIGQGVVAFLLAHIAQNLALVFGLYLGLIGIASGLLRKSRWMVAAIGYYLTLSFVSYGRYTNWQDSAWWVLGAILMTVFVIIYVVLYNRQSEARVHAQSLLKDLESANRQLTEYSARVEDLTISNERQRMARDLHDTLSQGLAGLILKLEAVDAHLVNERPERARAIVQQAMEQARASLSDARRAIDNLRNAAPPDLEEYVRREVEGFTNATGILCELDLSLNAAIPDDVAEIAIRVVSEGLNNIACHAQANHARLHILTRDSNLVVEIHDDGVGFDPDGFPAGHYGLLGIRERVRLAGGRCEINSKPGQGTSLDLRLPL